ncbi:MAG: TVP38/TMEM64 family protein [Halobacteriales archaeon]
MAGGRLWRRYLLLGGVGVTAAVGWLIVTPADVLTSIQAAYNGSSFLLVILVLYLLRPFVAGPVSLFTIVIGFRYGMIPGFGIALVGTVLTCLPPYIIGRHLRTDIGVLGWVSSAGSTVVDHAGDLRGTIAGRLSPAPADPVSYGAGIAGVPPLAYLLGTAIGEIPWTIGFILVGASMERVALTVPDRQFELLVFGTLGATLLLAAPAYRLLQRVRER